VVVEPFLCRCLREHQRQGVQFMYECVTGLVCSPRVVHVACVTVSAHSILGTHTQTFTHSLILSLFLSPSLSVCPRPQLAD